MGPKGGPVSGGASGAQWLSPCTTRCRAIQPGDDRPEYYHQNAVQCNLPKNHVPWHRLYHEVDHVGLARS